MSYMKLSTSSTHERSHWLAEDEQCRHRPSRNYVLRNYVRRTLIPPQREAKSSLIAARRQLTSRSEITARFLWRDPHSRIVIVVATN